MKQGSFKFKMIKYKIYVTNNVKTRDAIIIIQAVEKKEGAFWTSLRFVAIHG